LSSHLLLVEDNYTLLNVMREILESEGYRVTCAANGEEAFQAFGQETPDLILSDVMMPRMDGFALLEAVRAHPAGAAVPFLFLSARTERLATSTARILGADDYLFKPFEPSDLVEAVRSKLDRRRVIELFDTRSAHLQTVVMLANVVEARDRYTRGHIERVQAYARDLARLIGWNNEALAILEFGALLHDLGKIYIPRRVLNKRRKLLYAEWALLKKHPEIGAQMLEGIDHLQATLPYVMYHHERWDGRGYPARLGGVDIPQEGRLLAVVDTYDAMTSNRPYRRALSHETALAEIRKRAGTQFDPTLVEAFLDLHRNGYPKP